MKERKLSYKTGAKMPMNRSDLADFIKDLNAKQTISIKEINELAHAWGDDHVSELETYLFLKKNEATLQHNICLKDIELYLQFETNCRVVGVSESIRNVFTLLFPVVKQAKVSLKYFL